MHRSVWWRRLRCKGLFSRSNKKVGRHGRVSRLVTSAVSREWTARSDRVDQRPEKCRCADGCGRHNANAEICASFAANGDGERNLFGCEDRWIKRTGSGQCRWRRMDQGRPFVASDLAWSCSAARTLRRHVRTYMDPLVRGAGGARCCSFSAARDF